jgi:hypothetical protein
MLRALARSQLVVRKSVSSDDLETFPIAQAGIADDRTAWSTFGKSAALVKTLDENRCFKRCKSERSERALDASRCSVSDGRAERSTGVSENRKLWIANANNPSATLERETGADANGANH